MRSGQFLEIFARFALGATLLGCASRGEIVPASVEGFPKTDPTERPLVTPAQQGGEITVDAPGFVTWCASGGAPIVGLPVVDDQERVYVATSDGYLHAFERDGRFRWSYTVRGTPLGSVSLRPSDGAILMGTTGRYIYAINQDGSLRFRYPTLTPVWSGLFALNPSTVVFLGHDTRVYALSNSGQRRYRVRAPSTPMGGPVIARSDVVWLPLEDGVARFEAAFKLERFAFPGAVEEISVLGDDIIARAGTTTFHVTANGEVREVGRARMLSGDGHRVIAVNADGIELIDESLRRVPVELVDAPAAEQISAPPTFAGSEIWIPYRDGTVRLHDLQSGLGVVVAVGEGDLSTPVVGTSKSWGLISEPGGRFCAVQIARHPTP